MTGIAPQAPAPFRQARRGDERVRVLGADLDLVRQEEVWAFAARKVAAGEKAVVANHNLHSLYQLRRGDAEVAAFYGLADLVEVDSTPILAWARMTQKRGRAFHRCTYLDWRDSFWPMAVEKGWKVFYLGGAPGVVDEAARRLIARYPGLRLEGRHGYFDMAAGSEDARAVLDQITAFAPHILFAGMGMPRQEVWIARNHAALPPCVMFNVGAALDYEAGVQKAAPRWMGPLGLEWAYRLFVDPKRLFARYCLEPWTLLPLALGDLVRMIRRGPGHDRRGGERRRKDWREARPVDPANPGRRGSDWRGLGSRPPA